MLPSPDNSVQTAARLVRAGGLASESLMVGSIGERQGSAWFKRLDLARVDLGKGKRMLVAGGKLHATYLITLPADLDDHAR